MTLYSGWILHVMAFLSILNASIAAQPPKIHSVNVGSGGSFMYEPDTTFADVGDLVVFSFYPSNHSVVRGEYTGSTACGNGGCNPCVPFELIHLDQQGFASDNVLTQTLPNNGNALTFNITVKDTSPIWFYCTALGSCSPNGMVGVINPEKGTSVDKQRQAARAAPFQLQYGEPWPVEEASPGSLATSTSSNPSSSSVISARAYSRHISEGAIAGIVIGILIVLLFSAGIFYIVGRFKAHKDGINRTSAESPGDEDQRSLTRAEIVPWSSISPLRSEAKRRENTILAPILSSPAIHSSINPTSRVAMRIFGIDSPSQFAPRMQFDEKPPLSPPSGHPFFGANLGSGRTYELEADKPTALEIGASSQI